MKHVRLISQAPAAAQATIPWSIKLEAVSLILTASVPIFNAKEGIVTT